VGTAVAGGLYINEFATPSMGVAGAGAQAVATDASTAWHNPAGMTRIEGRELMVGGGLIYSTVKFDPDPDTPIPGGDDGDAGGPAPLLSAFYVHSLTDRLKVGADLISVSGAVLDYDDDWTGRFLNQEVSLLTLTFNPNIAYRLTDWLSVGGGIGLMYANLEMKLAAPPPAGMGRVEIDGDDVAAAFNLSALVELSERTRLGVVYWSELELDFRGDVKINPPGLQVGIDTELPLVQWIKTSIYHEFSDSFALLGTIGWEDWSAFDDVNLSTARGSLELSKNWEDTWHFSGGIHYRPIPKWLFQGGIAYDTSPVDAVDRTPDMPIDRQVRYAVGAQYEWSDRISVGGSFVYADYGRAKISNTLLRGDYDRNSIFFFALNLNWKF
jgi:long-chain fatty acid transport protein